MNSKDNKSTIFTQLKASWIFFDKYYQDFSKSVYRPNYLADSHLMDPPWVNSCPV